MAIKLNLLPPEARVTGTLGKVLNTTRMLGVIGVAFFLVFTLGISAFFILSTVTLNNLNSNLDALKSQITALQTTETQAVLLKDRIGKIKTALSLPNSVKNLDTTNPIISSLGPAASLGELDVDSQKVDLSLVFTSNVDTSAFIKSLSDSQSFTTATLTSFSYSPAGGILVGVRLIPK